MNKKRINSFNDILAVRCPKMFGQSVWFTQKSERETSPYNFFRVADVDGGVTRYEGATRIRIKEFFGKGRNDGKLFCYDNVNDVITDISIKDIILFQSFCKHNHIKFNLKTMEADYDED